MPVYDYVCLDCHKPFETVLTLNTITKIQSARTAAVKTWSRKRRHSLR